MLGGNIQVGNNEGCFIDVPSSTLYTSHWIVNWFSVTMGKSAGSCVRRTSRSSTVTTLSSQAGQLTDTLHHNNAYIQVNLKSNILAKVLSDKTIKIKLDSYSCKQLLKDSYLTFTLTLRVNIHSLVCGFKDKSLRTEMVNQTAESTVKSSNFHVFWS